MVAWSNAKFWGKHSGLILIKVLTSCSLPVRELRTQEGSGSDEENRQPALFPGLSDETIKVGFVGQYMRLL